MSELPAASHSLYWANWSVVEDGIGTMVTVSPVAAVNFLNSSVRNWMSAPVAPETKCSSTALAAVAMNGADDTRATPVSNPAINKLSFMNFLPKGRCWTGGNADDMAP